MDKDLRTLAPWYRLCGPTPAAVLTEDYNTTNLLLLPFLALRNQQMTLAFLATASIAAEVWTIFLGSPQVSAGDFGTTTYWGDLAGLAILVVCNAVMLLALVAVACKCWRKAAPVRLDTIAAKARLLGGSRVGDFGGKVGLGWADGPDEVGLGWVGGPVEVLRVDGEYVLKSLWTDVGITTSYRLLDHVYTTGSRCSAPTSTTKPAYHADGGGPNSGVV